MIEWRRIWLKCTHGAMQCAAVNTCVEDIKLAPQYWPELLLEGLNKAANQGHSFLSASCPLTIFKIVGTFLRICGSWQPERICCSCNLYQKYKIQIDLIEAKAWYFISIIFPHVLTSLGFPSFPFAENVKYFLFFIYRRLHSQLQIISDCNIDKRIVNESLAYKK